MGCIPYRQSTISRRWKPTTEFYKLKTHSNVKLPSPLSPAITSPLSSRNRGSIVLAAGTKLWQPYCNCKLMKLVLEKCNAQTAGLHICMHRYTNAVHDQWRLKSSICIVYSNLEYTVSNCIILCKGPRLLSHYSDYNTSWVTGKLESNFPQGQRFFSSLQHPYQPRPALGPISLRYSSWGTKLTTYFYLVLKLSMNGAIIPLPHTSSWHGT